MTIYAMDKLLGAAVRFLHLATAPKEANLPQEIQTALAASGYFDAFPKSAEDIQPDTAEKLNRLIDDARASFPFDLTRSLWKENDKDMTMNGSSRRKQLAMRLHITTFAPSLFAF